MYIVKKDLPKKCSSCPFREHTSCTLTHSYASTKARRQDCPLIEIRKPHGPIVDLNSIRAQKFPIIAGERTMIWNAALNTAINNAAVIADEETK